MAFENITLEKGMYGVPGKSFTQVLEELDSSHNYAGTPMAGLDAYQRQLKRFGIKVSGPGCDTVEKFFTSSQSAALFPEYVARAVKQGMEMANHLPDMVATVTMVNALDYRTIKATTDENEKIADAVTEGNALPETVIKTSDALVKLQKRGRLLSSSYEALRFHKLDLFTVILRQIGAYIARADERRGKRASERRRQRRQHGHHSDDAECRTDLQRPGLALGRAFPVQLQHTARRYGRAAGALEDHGVQGRAGRAGFPRNRQADYAPRRNADPCAVDGGEEGHRSRQELRAGDGAGGRGHHRLR